MTISPRRLRAALPALCLGLLLVAPAPSVAQADASEAAARLHPGQLVRIQAPGLAIEGGRVSAFAGGMLQIVEEGQEWDVDPRTIERLEVRTRPVVQNALIFGLIGTVVGYAGDKIKSAQRNPDPSSDGLWKGLAGGVVFGIAFGLTQTSWSVRFPR
jgi:hypothetical protein